MNNKEKLKLNKAILIWIIVLIISISIDIYGDKYHKNANNNSINNNIVSDDNAVDWNGSQQLNGYGQSSDKISIPCFD